MSREMSGGTKVMVKVILVFFFFPVVVQIINFALGWVLLLPLHFLPKAEQRAFAPFVTGLTVTVAIVCGVLAVRPYWPRMIEKYDDEVDGAPAQTPP